MKRLLVLTVTVLAFYTGFHARQLFGVNGQLTNNSWSVYFSPKGGCTEAVVHELDQAKSTVLVQAYSFTSAPIAKALVGAHRRGVEVEVILDRSQRSEKYSSADFVAHAGISTLIDAKHVISHNKVMVIDGQTVITGSFNFTKAAEESHAENFADLEGFGIGKAVHEELDASQGTFGAV